MTIKKLRTKINMSIMRLRQIKNKIKKTKLLSLIAVEKSQTMTMAIRTMSIKAAPMAMITSMNTITITTTIIKAIFVFCNLTQISRKNLKRVTAPSVN